jgi:hypothetical protein
MQVQEALAVLGVNRTVWIDDIFSTSRAQLITALLEHEHLVPELDMADLAATLNEFDVEREALRDFIERASGERTATIRTALLDKIAERTGVREFGDAFVQKMRNLLGIAQDDCWDFPQAGDQLTTLCATPTDQVSCIVDLNNGLGDQAAGLETIRLLSEKTFKGTVFLLTNEATTATEAQLEKALREQLREGLDEVDIPPVCVIAKGRFGDFTDDGVIKESLRIAIKRAGLRRSLHLVLGFMKSELEAAYITAQETLYGLAPEQLDQYIVEMGYGEGLSELNVVERAVTAQMATSIRKGFASSPVAQASAMRMRKLRQIELQPKGHDQVEESLSLFRRLEIWEEPALINDGLSPLASGDVFSFDPFELTETNAKRRRYVLLGQPCDVQLRGDGHRRQPTAFFVPLVEVPLDEEDKKNIKKPHLPFKLDGQKYACDFGEVALVQLTVLELASYRSDGRVCFEKNQPVHALLPGLEIQHGKIKQQCDRILNAPPARGNQIDPLADPKYLLTFGGRGVLSTTTKAKRKELLEREGERLDARITWGLRRDGRIRASYAAAMLRNYLAVVGREAYDLDFTEQRQSKPSAAMPNPEVVAVPPGTVTQAPSADAAVGSSVTVK